MADQNTDEHHEAHVHGSMNIETQEKTFEGFLSLVGRGMAVCIIALILLYMING
ncbi:MAG: aa3-type cytochrome c oxidase subunit IV [Rhodobacteraceae bacterium]|nr:aa3-type cytochrome c oxidase subunit IV [Paracoccaceae bacterium]